MPCGPTCLKPLTSTRKLFILIYLSILWLCVAAACSEGDASSVPFVSRGILRINVPGYLRLEGADSVLKSSDKSVEIVISHLSRSDSTRPTAILSTEDLVAGLQDSLAFEAQMPYMSKPIGRFSGLLRGTFFVAARNQGSLLSDRLEVLVLESPKWFHVIQVRILAPSHRLSREQLDEMYDSAAEIQGRPPSNTE